MSNKNTTEDYGQLLEQYMSDVKSHDEQEREMKRLDMVERTFSYTSLDFVFPWHMRLGKYDKTETTDEDFAYTPFKTFNRRRNFLVWLHCDKFKFLFTDEEVQKRNRAEDLLFKTSLGLKGLGLFLFLNLRLYKRPAGRSILYDLMLMYFGTYCILGSNIPGVFMTWHLY